MQEATKHDDPTVGEAPILEATGPTVTIEGREYPLRRLGVRDTFALARIMGAGARASGVSIGENPTTKELMSLLLAGMGAAEGQVLALLADVIGVTRAELEDPERFPMGSEVEIVAALAEHQDLRAFFAKLGGLMAKLPEAQVTLTGSRGA